MWGRTAFVSEQTPPQAACHHRAILLQSRRPHHHHVTPHHHVPPWTYQMQPWLRRFTISCPSPGLCFGTSRVQPYPCGAWHGPRCNSVSAPSAHGRHCEIGPSFKKSHCGPHGVAKHTRDKLPSSSAHESSVSMQVTLQPCGTNIARASRRRTARKERAHHHSPSMKRWTDCKKAHSSTHSVA